MNRSMTGLSLAAGALVVVAVLPAVGEARQIGPTVDLCAEINSPQSGDELILAPGEYQGPCAIRRGGALGAPLVIRAADPAQRPRIVYGGSSSNVFEVRASHVTIRGLEFGPSQREVDAVRIFGGNDVTIEDCLFSRLGGIAVVANHFSVVGLVVRRNVIRDSQATAMYFGCHDGVGCTVTGLLVERNLIQGVTAPDPEIGYGVQVKLNSVGIVRNNVIVNTKGPGIMVYGSRTTSGGSVIERNVTIGSRTASGIVIGGGPAIVRNNIATSNEQAGVDLEDYKKRGLVRDVVVANNTVYRNRGGGIGVPDSEFSGVMIVNNAAEAPAGTQVYPAAQAGLRMAGNVDCTAGPCFTNPEQQDFSPFAGSRLNGAGVFLDDASMPREDFFRVRRSTSSPTAGAIERPAGPLSLTLEP